LSQSGTGDSQIHQSESGQDRRRILRFLLALTFIHGLVYLAILPPWQHYDEPTHFEYVRLIAERNRLPKPGDYDLTMRREIAASMQAAGFYKDIGAPPNQFLSDQPPDIGLSELAHPPLYYILLAIPQKLVMYQDVETQLCVARLTSLLLYLLVVVAAYGLVREIFPARGWLATGIAVFIAMLPPLTDLMTSVNNDVGAAAAGSLLLWAGVRLARRGPSLPRITAVLLLAAACAATKITALSIAVAVLLFLGLGYIPQRSRRWAWLSLALAIPLALVAAFGWGEHAAHWQSGGQPTAPNRAQANTPFGGSVLILSADGASHPRALFQELDRGRGQSLRGETVTFGAWVKAPAEVEGTFLLQLDDGSAAASYRGEASADWSFHAVTATVKTDAPGIAVYVILPNSQDAAQELFVDGLVLVDGAMPLTEPAQFEGPQAGVVPWGAARSANLLKNASAEQAWPSIRTWIGTKQVYRTSIAAIFYSLWDLTHTAWAYPAALSVMVNSFWGTFAWSHLSLPAPYFPVLEAITALGLVGAGIRLVRRRRARTPLAPWQWQAWGMMGAAFAVAWAGAILRLHPIHLTRHIFWPGARYAVGAIVPTSTFLLLGLTTIVPKQWLRGAAWLGLLGLIALDALALWGVILPYYYG
jgi:hypothetical protein